MDEKSENKNNKEMVEFMKSWQTLAVGVLLGALSIAGAFQLTLAGEVKSNTADMRAVKEQLAETRKSFDDRMSNIIRLWEAQLNSERELISLVREQIRVIERNSNSSEWK